GELHALRLGVRGRLLAGLDPLDQIGHVRELLLEVALVALEPLEDVAALVPTPAEPAVMSSTSVVHGHLLSRYRSRKTSIRSRARVSASAHSSSRRPPVSVSS